MPVPLDIIWGVLSLLSWGVADYLGRQLSIRMGSLVASFYVQSVGILVPVVYFLGEVSLRGVDTSLDWRALATWGPLLGLLWMLAYLAYYRGLQTGMVSVVTAVASAWLAVSVLVAVLFLGELIGPVQLLLIAIIIGGILLLALRNTSTTRETQGTGLWFGIGAMLAIGLGAAFLKPLSHAVGPVMATLVPKLITATLLWVLIQVQRTPLSGPEGRPWRLILPASALDSLGYVFYTIGVSRAPIFIIAPVAAAHPIVTMTLAWFLLHERPSRLQALGIGITIIGVLSLGASVRV